MSISSSLTSTSHTLTLAPAMAPPTSSSLAATQASADPLALLETLARPNRHAFLQPTPLIPAASLNLVKATLESFAGVVSDEQARRLRELNRKRKRSERVRPDEAEVLKVRKVHVDGFETGQVWQQAKRIITGALKSSEEALRELEEERGIAVDGSSDGSDEEIGNSQDESISGESGEEMDGSDDDASEGSSDQELDDMEVDGELGDDGFMAFDESDGEVEGEEEDEAVDEHSEDESEEEEPAELVEDVHGLNDGFFSIDEFNRQTEWFEEQDAKGDPYTDVVSDEEEIDWDADPYAAKQPSESKKSKKGSKPSEEDEFDGLGLGMDVDDDGEDGEDDDDDEGGPTFGNMDLYAPEGDSDAEMDGEVEQEEEDEGEFNANDIYYKDFFAPPPRKRSDNPRDAKPKKSVRFDADAEEAKAEVDRAMRNVRRDLFDDLSDHGGDSDEDALSDVSAGDPKSRRSAHERRQAKIAEEIRKLEAAAVAKREWTLSGEATAAERPVNSLLEEDLDFEHVGKPVPVITPAVSEDIEALIKRRILEDEFDDVLRRRPDAEGGNTARRGLVDVDDTKSKKGLAEIYEEEHVKRNNPDTYVSKADEKLQKEEREVEGLWRDVCARLDALSSWHYKPKPSAPSLTVVSDVATVAMEDAQPATAQGVAGGESALAPQEVYRAGKETAEQGEVVGKSGLPVAREEMSREDKARRRRRAKERTRKAGEGQTNGGGAKSAGAASGGKASKKDTVADLKRGGVKVINKKGEILDVDGNKPKAAKVVSSGGYKL